MTMFPSLRHVVFARNTTEANTLRSLFRDQFGIELEESYMEKLIGNRLGVTVLSFSEGYGKVTSSGNAIEAASLNEAKVEMPEIQLPETSRGR